MYFVLQVNHDGNVVDQLAGPFLTESKAVERQAAYHAKNQQNGKTHTAVLVPSEILADMRWLIRCEEDADAIAETGSGPRPGISF